MRFSGTFGEWLKQRRKALDLTQSELAEQVSCAVVTIRKLEADVTRPSKQIAERLGDVLAIVDADRAGFVSFARRVALAPTHAIPRTDNLPAQSTPFIGKSEDLQQINDRLTDPNCRLLTLVGRAEAAKRDWRYRRRLRLRRNLPTAAGLCRSCLSTRLICCLPQSRMRSSFHFFLRITRKFK